jgi:hypothetical protein
VSASRALAARQLAGPLRRVQAEPLDPAACQRVVPARVQTSAELQVVLHAQSGVGRRVLGDEADLGQLCRAGSGAVTEHLDRAARRRQQADGQVQQRRLAGPVGADEPDDPAGRDLQRAVRQRRAAPVALAQPVGA